MGTHFYSFNVQKCVVEHTFKLKNIGVYYYLQQKILLMSISIKMS